MGLCDQSCGCGDPAPLGFERAWMYDESSGALSELTFDPSERGAAATGISNSGIITGWEDPSPRGTSARAGFWTVTGGATLLTDQNGQPASDDYAVAANDDGNIIGYHDSYNGRMALLWSGPDHAMTILPAPACNQCGEIIISANAINDSGTVVGAGPINASNSPTGVGTAALEWRGGAVTSLGSFNGSNESAAYGINSRGDVVGFSQIGPDRAAPAYAFLYHDGAMTDLGALPGDSGSSAAAVNDGGEVVGASDSHAFLYVNGTMYNLNSVIDPTDPLAGVVTLESAVSINSRGWIAVNGTDTRDGMERAFLLIPSH